MSKRSKFIISLAIGVFTLLSIFVSLVAVFAEENQIVRNLNASFKVYNADCHVSASFSYGSSKTGIYSAAKDFTVSGLEEDEKYLTFDKTAETLNVFQEGMLKPTNDIVLTKENNSVIFKFDIANFDFDALEITIMLDGKPNESLDIEYSKDGIAWFDYNVRINLDGTEGIGSQETSYFVRLSLIDDSQAFSFNQDFSLTIHSKI